MRGKKHESHSTGRRILFALAALWLLSNCGGTAGSDARADELDQIGDDIAAEIAADVEATAVAPTPEPTTPPTPTPDPTATPTPTPTPDPEVVLQQQAEAVALEYWQQVDKILVDPNNVDLTRAIQLEALDTTMEDWALKFLADRQEVEANGGDVSSKGTPLIEVIKGATERVTWSEGDRFTVDLCLGSEDWPLGSTMEVTIDHREDRRLLVSALKPIGESCSLGDESGFSEAELIAVEYYTEVRNIAGDARIADLTRVDELAAPDGFVTDYGQRLAASLLENNHYLVLADRPVQSIEDSVRFEAWRGDAVIAVDLCVERTGIWRDFDTDEISRETLSDPLFVTVRLTLAEPLLVTSFSEAGQLEEALGEVPTCELGVAE